MKYKCYRSTVYDWLPSVPKHWQPKTLRSLTSVSSERKGNQPAELLSVYREYGVIRKKSRDDNHNVESEDTSNYKRVGKGDLVMNKMKMWQGSLGVSEYDGIVSPAYIVCHLTDTTIYAKYLHMLLRSPLFKTYYNRVSYGVRVGQWDMRYDDFKSLVIYVPPREEQDQIVRYLDWQVSRINKLIAAKKSAIVLLKENKQAIVGHLVTRGLAQREINPSEIYWLSGVPAGWRITKLKHILTKERRSIPEGAELLICSNSGDVKLRGDGKLGLVASSDEIYQGVAQGDLLIHGMDTWHGAIAISSYDGMCTPVVHVCSCRESKRFVAYYLKMMAYTKVFKKISNGVRQNTSDFRSWDKVGDLLIALPSIDEQERIADYIDVEQEKCDSMIAVYNSEIDMLHELRTRIISDVVTGQIDVRGIEVPDFDMVEEMGTDDESLDDVDITEDAEEQEE